MSLAHVQSARQGDRRSLLVVCAITAAILCVELVGGVLTGSLALLADAGHVLTDLLALLVALVALVLASKPPTLRKTWGYHRLEILSAFINGVLLLGISCVILWHAWGRLAQPRDIHGGGMTAIAIVGLLANLLAVWVLSRASGSLNMRGARWHVLGDTISSIGVVLAGVLITLTGVSQIDVVVSVGIALIIVYGAVRLVWEASDVLLESAPGGLDCRAIQAAIRTVAGVVEIRDLHIWSITTGLPALTGHVIIPAARAGEGDALLAQIKALLRERFGIAHSTIQIQTELFEDSGDVH